MSTEHLTPSVHAYDDIKMEETQTEAIYLEIVAGEYEGFNTHYDDTVVEEKKYEVVPKNSKKKWLMISAFSFLVAVLCGAGVAAVYFVVPGAGKLLDLDATENFVF